jgi:alpha-L-rhamnosidase
VFIYDLGQNIVGWCRLRVQGPRGTTLTLRHAEALQSDGNLYVANLRSAKAADVYVLKGEGLEVYEPRFTYHGFRYVELRGFPGTPDLSTLEGRVVHDDVRPTGEFVCSDETINRIYRNAVWGIRGNYRSVPTDCPQRDERQGWLGDRSEESRGEMYLFDLALLYAKWVQDMADAQRENGSVPDVAPSYYPFYTDNVTWPSSSIIIPGVLYEMYGDSRPLELNYPAMRRWIDYMCGFLQNGLIDKDQYGDWCVPPESPELIHSNDPARKTAGPLIASAYFYHDLQLIARYATTLGIPEDAARFRNVAAAMREAFNRKYLNTREGYYDNGTQTSCVLPLAFGIPPARRRGPIFRHLVDKIMVESNGHIGTGLIGCQWLMRVLTDNGRADIGYILATRTDYPSWGYMIENDATTIWELWNGNTADPAMNSHNHVMLLGDLLVWLYAHLAGIQPDVGAPGFKHIIMKPQPIEGLSFVRAGHVSPYGEITSHWRREGDTFDWQLRIPPNTTADVHVPTSGVGEVREGEVVARKATGVRFLRRSGNAAVFRVQAGAYRFQSRLKPTTSDATR